MGLPPCWQRRPDSLSLPTAVMPELVAERLVGLVRFMRERAEAGDEKFRADIEAGHANLYIEDAQYVLRNAEDIRARLQ